MAKVISEGRAIDILQYVKLYAVKFCYAVRSLYPIPYTLRPKGANMKAVVTVIGKDNVGIIASISNECAKHGVNIVDITQSVLRDYFAMIMLVEIENMKATLKDFQSALDLIGKEKGLDIRVMHEDIFN